jgi:hypothetical protein
MAFDKKQYDESTIGSAEELDTYGVWVKSGPQDLADGLAGAASFDAGLDPEFDADFEAGAIPFEDDFDDNFGNLGVVGLGLTDELDDDFDDTIAARFDQDTEEPPTPLLMKIADEITSIRSELNTLKREFADIRAEGAPDLESEPPQGGFFNEDDDEAVALTGDEMNNFLTSADFSDEEGLGEDPQRSADEAALKELAEQQEEEIAPLEQEEETPPEGALPDEDFDAPSFDGLSFDESPVVEDEAVPDLAEDDLVALEPLEPIEESDELRDLRLEGAVPQTSAPEDLAYLESDPLAEAITEETEETEETVTEETLAEEPVLDEPAAAEEELSLDTGADDGADLIFEDSSFELTLDDLPAGEEPVEEPAAEPALEETELSLDSETAESAEPALDETELSLDDETTESAELTFDETELSLDDEPAESAELTLDATELSLDDEPAESAELTLDATELSLDDEPAESAELTLDATELSLDDEPAESAEPALDETELSLDAEPVAEPSPDDADISFDSDSLELSEAVLDDTDFSFDADTEPAVEEPNVDEPNLEEITEEQAFDVESLDLSADNIVEPPLEEPAPGDISLDMDDFAPADLEADDSHTGIIDDSLAQVIPEGFEVNAAEADVSPDDELEAFAEEELAAKTESGAGGELGIPSGLETELKKVLSYMDHLLESLPEDKIEEFAKSEYFDTYKKIFKELGLV